MADLISWLIKHLTKSQIHRVQTCQHAPVIVTRQSVQQFIGNECASVYGLTLSGDGMSRDVRIGRHGNESGGRVPVTQFEAPSSACAVAIHRIRLCPSDNSHTPAV